MSIRIEHTGDGEVVVTTENGVMIRIRESDDTTVVQVNSDSHGEVEVLEWQKFTTIGLKPLIEMEFRS